MTCISPKEKIRKWKESGYFSMTDVGGVRDFPVILHFYVA